MSSRKSQLIKGRFVPIRFGQYSWKDYTYQADITIGKEKTIGENIAGLTFRYSDDNNYYAVLVDSNADAIKLQKKQGGIVAQLASAANTINTDTSYRVKVTTQGTSIKIYLDGTLKIETTDSTFTTGKIGLKTYRAATDYDNISVDDLGNSCSVSAPDPNVHPGWSYRVMAGPNYIGLADFITGQDGAKTFISSKASRHDIYVSIKQAPLSSLTSQTPPVPFPWQQGLNTVSEIYEFKALSAINGTPLFEFDNPVTVILPYDTTKLGSVSTKLLRIAWYDTSSKRWRVLNDNTLLDWTNKTVANTAKRFSYFAVVYPASAFAPETTSGKETLGPSPSPSPEVSPTPTPAGYDLKVKVVDTDKKPVVGAKVTLHSTPQTTVTDDSGIAFFKNVESGQHKVVIAYNNYQGEQTVNLTGEVKEFDLNVQIEPVSPFLAPRVLVVIGLLVLSLAVLAFVVIRGKVLHPPV